MTNSRANPRFALQQFVVLAATLIFAAGPLTAYSVLSHEALVDALWDVSMAPAIKARFPLITAAELKKTHGFAYGGAIIQDLGYYPGGDKLFSDLTHYVRSGDFVVALIRDSQSAEEYAFALGALSHYVSDTEGHRLATNHAVPKLYPKVRKKYGDVVTYEDDPAAHLKTEFGFDVLEVAKGNFAPEAYHDFIGFSVSRDLLERAFHETYGLPLSDLFSNEDRAIGTFRHVVSTTIPRATRIAWHQRQDQVQHSQPGVTHRKFEYNLRRSSYEREWGKEYDRPGPFDRFLAFLLDLLPKIGPLKALSFKMPTPEVEEMFMHSFNECVAVYLKTSGSPAAEMHLADLNFDVGVVTTEGQYHLADETYEKLLHELAEKKFAGVTKPLGESILRYYAHQSGHPQPAELEQNLKQLKDYLASST